MTVLRILKRTIFLFIVVPGLCQSQPYYGKPLGYFQTISNDIKGEVFAIDDNTIFIKGFSYDGNSDDAVFWAGSSEYPDASGLHIPSETSQFMPLPLHINQNIILRLPEGSNIRSLRWLSVWNRNLSKSLGALILSNPIQPPHPMAIGPLINTKRGVSTGDILILDTQTFLVPDFNYDGSEKEAYWWLSKGTKPGEGGIRLLENGSDAPLQENRNSTVVITLPNGHLVGDYDTLSIWSKSEADNYGFVDVPKNLNIPPSPRTLGKQELEMDEFNCEMLNDNLGLEIRWLIKGDDVIIHLVGNIGPFEYMALGLSKDDTETKFDSADAVVAGVDANGKGYAIDYFFESNEKCENGRGLCPDNIHGSLDNLELLEAERRGNFTIVAFKRHLRAEDKVYDQNIYTDGPQAILWAVGQLLPDRLVETPAVQSRGNLLLDFGREPNWNCPPPKKLDPQPAYAKEKNQHIHCPYDRSFRAQLGSSPRSNVKKVWFINGLPTPEITVQRGNTYTFIVEGGLNPPFHHPFYITNNKEGGLYKNILEANDALEITYAGIQEDHLTGTIFPTAEGRLCDWSYANKIPEFAVEAANRDINPSLVLKCEPGQSGRLIWTPSADTPDVVYYQSFMERNLGGKIHVVDFCEETNPHRYLEVTRKGGKPNSYPKKDGLERESEENNFFLSSNPKKDGYSNGEETGERSKDNENLNESIPTELIHEMFPPKADQYTLSNNVLNSFRMNNASESINTDEKQILLESTTSPTPQTSRNPEEAFPHDESERSDTHFAHHTDFRKIVNQNKAALNSHRIPGDLPIKHPTHSSSEISSISSLRKLTPQEFRPHFEGGFVPLVMNPMKEKEFAQTKEFIYATQYHNRPHRPFLYNESVPFHGTFKPGVPDFSGFNISNYSQEDASIMIAHNQDNFPILSASKPQPIHKPFPPMGPIPLHMLQRHNEPPRRPQRPQEFGPRYRQQNPSFTGTRQNVFPPIPINNKQNFPITNLREEDLAGVSSQRVYVSLQTTGDLKSNPPNVPPLGYPSVRNRKPQNTQSNKMIYPPPIQRRPDFYEEKEANVPSQKVPQRNFNTPRIPPNINKPNPQKLNIPIMQSGGLQGKVNTRPQIPNPKPPLKSNLPGNLEQIMIPHGPMRHPYPMMHIPHRERVPQVPAMQKGIPIRHPLPDDKLRMNGALLNHPQNTENRFPYPVHMLNNKGKLPQESDDIVESQETDSATSRVNRPLPVLPNAELLEIPNKNVPQNFVKERPGPSPSVMMQNLPLNGSFNAFVANSNIRNPHDGPISGHKLSSQKNNPLDTSSIAKLSNTSENENVPSSAIGNRPSISETYATYFQNTGNGNSKLDESTKPESHPANFDHHNFEKSILETLTSDEFSSSKPINKDLSIFSDYHPEVDESDRSDSVEITGNFGNYGVPFGARLKLTPNGTKAPLGPVREVPQIPFGVIRKPQTFSTNNRNRNSSNHKNESPTTTTTSSPITTTTTATTARSSNPTTEATLLALDSLSNIRVSNTQNMSFEKEENPKHLYYTPPFSSLPAFSQFFNVSEFNKDTASSDEVKHIPIIADTLEDIIQTKYIGRKNILPQNSNFSQPIVMMPPKVSENINLPQISENPPTHDNRTDYSILNHILALIGGPPEQNEQQVSS